MKLSKEMSDKGGELNCIYRKIKLEIPGKSEENKNEDPTLNCQNFSIINLPSNTSVVLFLESDTEKTSSQNITSYNVSISVKVSPMFPSGNESVTYSESYILSKDDKNSGNYQSNVTTAHSSPVASTNMYTSEKFLPENEDYQENKNEKTLDYSTQLEKQENNVPKRLSNIKSSIKRQLTSNKYVDICRNPEWPFVKQKNKPLSKNEQVGSAYPKVKKDAQKETETVNNDENKDSDQTPKKSSRGRTRQWLESLSTLFDGVYTQRSTLGRSAGLGLFSDRHFEKNNIITEFVGWVIDRKEALRLRSEGKATHICDLVKPSLYLDGEKDPKPFIGGGSFANDGSTFLGGPGNNSKFWKWYDEREGRSRVFLKATQEIQPGEEIFVGYCKDYWVDFAEKDSTNQCGKTNNPAINVSRTPKKDAQDCQNRGRKRSIKMLESIDNVKADSKLTNADKQFPIKRTIENRHGSLKKKSCRY